MRKTILLINFVLLGVGAVLWTGMVSADSETNKSGGNVGINGAACNYFTIASAIAAAPDGATIYVRPSIRTEFIGTIDKNLTFVPGTSAGPTFSGCEAELTTATSSTVLFQANGFSQDATGGMVRVTNGATVTFRHMSFRDATATNGGVMAVTNGARVFLDDADVYEGVASSNGGGVYVLDGILVLNNGSVIRSNEATLGNGGGISVIDGTLTVNHGSIGGTIAWENTAGADGGGIYANLSDVNLKGSASIVGFNSSGRNGGGVAAYETDLSVEDIDINGNSAYSNGGGIYIEDSVSTLTVEDAQVRNNVTTNSTTNEGGGGIWAFSGVAGTIDNTLVENNFSENLGGGIGWRTSGSLSISNSTVITANVADASGGGMYVVTSVDLDIANSEISGNTTGHSGGAFYLLGGSLDMDNVQMFRNSADWGGAIRFAFVDDIDIANSFISLNTAVEDGGAIFADDVQMVMTDTIFTVNQSGANGGTMWFGDPDSTWVGNGVTVSGSSTTTSSTNEGGGCFYIEDALSVMLDDLHMDSCNSDNLGGAFFIENGAPVTVTNAYIGYNEGTIGGGFYIIHSDVTLDNVTLDQNQARTHHGGGIYSFGVPSDLIVRNSTITDNTATIYGGGIYAAYGTSIIENTLIQGNHANDAGGGIFATQGNFTIQSAFANGRGSTGCDPWALSANEYCTEVRNNSADRGGGIMVQGDLAPPTTYQTYFTASSIALIENTATTNGSAFYTERLETWSTLENVIVRGHRDSDVVYQDGPTDLTISSSSLVGNFENPLYTNSVSSTITMTNSIIWENLGGPYVRFGADFTRSCNNSQSTLGGSQSMGSINQDPIFVSDPDRGDYHLHSISPSVDACNTGPARDLDGLYRPNNGGTYDMGAFELEGQTVPTSIKLNELAMKPAARNHIFVYLLLLTLLSGVGLRYKVGHVCNVTRGATKILVSQSSAEVSRSSSRSFACFLRPLRNYSQRNNRRQRLPK